YPRRSAIMALAGPAANFTLMFLGAIGIQVGRHFDVFNNQEWGAFLGQVLFVMFSLNLLLGIFNLVPVPPLDGSSGIMLFMDATTARLYLEWLGGGNFGLVALLIVMLCFKYIYGPIEAFVGSLLLRRYF